MSEAVQVRLVFVDGGDYHREDVTIPAALLDGYDRLIDCLREERDVLRQIYVDIDRLCAAYVLNGSAPVAESTSTPPSRDSASPSSSTGSLIPFSG